MYGNLITWINVEGPKSALRIQRILRKIMLLKSIRGKNKAKLSLALYIKACRIFYIWRMQVTQCNELTLNSGHYKFQELKSENPAGYFKYLKRREKYIEESLSNFETPRIINNNQIKLSSLKILSKSIIGKKIFWAWRSKIYKRKIIRKFARLYWRKKTLVKCIRYIYDKSTINKVGKRSEEVAVNYEELKLCKKVFNTLKQLSIKRKNLKKTVHSKSQYTLNRKFH